MMDIISVDRSRGRAYVAWSSEWVDALGHRGWETNVEVDLNEAEDAVGHTLPDGRLEPWIRIRDVRVVS